MEPAPSVATGESRPEEVPSAERLLPLVGAIARSVSRRLPPTVEMRELINDGVVGLLSALRRYDPARRVGFSTYAGHRIRGAMLDGLRARDPLPRTIRRVQKKLLGAEPGGTASPKVIQLVELEQAAGVPADEAGGPEALAIDADLRRRLWAGIAALPARDREILVLRMVQEMTLRRVAARIGLSMTRTIEIQQRALLRLRRLLEGAQGLRTPRVQSWRGQVAEPRVPPTAAVRQEEQARDANLSPTPDVVTRASASAPAVVDAGGSPTPDR